MELFWGGIFFLRQEPHSVFPADLQSTGITGMHHMHGLIVLFLPAGVCECICVPVQALTCMTFIEGDIEEKEEEGGEERREMRTSKMVQWVGLLSPSLTTRV